MQHYFAINKELEILESDKHHIINVMRMNINDKFIIVYDKVMYECIIKYIDLKDVKYDVVKVFESTKNKGIVVKMAVSLIKEQKFDYLIQKITEIGVDEIIPLKTDRSIIKISSKDFDKKKERYNRIVKEASEQSHRLTIPFIDDLRDIDYLINNKCDLNILFTVNERSNNVKEIFNNNRKCGTLLLVIGPEGGFSQKEEQKLMDNGFICASLGDNVLRSETAALYIMSIIDYNYLR